MESKWRSECCIRFIINKDLCYLNSNVSFSSAERRIYSAGKTFLCFIVFLICIQPLLLCCFGEFFFWIIFFSENLLIISQRFFEKNVYLFWWTFLSHTFYFAVVSVTRLLWRNILIIKNQHLTFVKKDNLRTFSYTVRNPGIVNIILHLQGEPNIDAIRDSINNAVFQRKTKSDELIFPKLSAKLISCWGFYAWKMCPEYVIVY